MLTHPYETLPSYDDLLPYMDRGLSEIRFRKDGRLAVGLFLDESKSTIIGVSSLGTETPYTFPVEQDAANEAFMDPYGHADKVGKKVLQNILSEAA